MDIWPRRTLFSPATVLFSAGRMQCKQLLNGHRSGGFMVYEPNSHTELHGIGCAAYQPMIGPPVCRWPMGCALYALSIESVRLDCVKSANINWHCSAIEPYRFIYDMKALVTRNIHSIPCEPLHATINASQI